jgi:hypothetical protein
MKHLESSEQRRLTSEQDGWNLTVAVETTRTRGGGNGRLDLQGMVKKKMLLIDVDSDSSEEKSRCIPEVKNQMKRNNKMKTLLSKHPH